MKRIITKSEKETFDFGYSIGKSLRGGEVILLDGELGAGKTVFTKGLASALGITQPITSPTFTILNIYENEPLCLYHYDAYRLNSGEEAYEAGLTEYFYEAGGVCVIEWAQNVASALTGEEITDTYTDMEVSGGDDSEFGDNSAILSMDIGDIQYAYCTEFFIINMKKSTTLSAIDRLREKLMAIGDSVICIGDLELVKVHVHTNQPGKALTYALELGELDRPKIENMLEQNRQLKAKLESEKKEMGMLAICTGAGLSEIFKDLFVDRIIEGGQTMNPSASDIANAAQKINAEHIFVFPNNKNIILAAEQARNLVENKQIHVIPTKNVPQGFAAALEFNPEVSAEENKANMIHALDNVKVGQVTYAVRNTSLNGFSIKEGDIIGLDDKKILAKSHSLEETVLKLIGRMKEDFHQVITLYYGEDVKEEEAAALCETIAEKYPDCDVDFHNGGQAVYYYIMSLE